MDQMVFPFSKNTHSATPSAVARIDTVLFDYGQVFSNPPDPAAWAQMLSITGLDEAHLHEAYWPFATTMIVPHSPVAPTGMLSPSAPVSS